MKRQYVIEGQLFPASDGYNWAAVDASDCLFEYADKPKMTDDEWCSCSCINLICDSIILSTHWTETLTQVTEPTLDDFCNRIYGSDFEKLETQVQRWLENLYNKGALKL